ncbi:ERBB-3 binding protein 1 [Smittium culicis]|nr:ERBB-3 binding protein 1 [Smittium culicis]
MVAAYLASEIAARQIAPGKSSKDVINAINNVAKEFGCQVAEHSFTSQLDQFVFSGKKTFCNKVKTEGPMFDHEFNAGETYSLDVILSTGTGISKTSEYAPTIYSRNVNRSYRLKLKSSRLLFGKVCSAQSIFPFLMRETIDERDKMGLSECVKNELLIPYSVSSDRNGEFVAQFKMTVFVHHSGPLRLTAPVPSPLPDLSFIPETSDIASKLSVNLNQMPFCELPKNAAISSISPPQLLVSDTVMQID